MGSLFVSFVFIIKEWLNIHFVCLCYSMNTIRFSKITKTDCDGSECIPLLMIFGSVDWLIVAIQWMENKNWRVRANNCWHTVVRRLRKYIENTGSMLTFNINIILSRSKLVVLIIHIIHSNVVYCWIVFTSSTKIGYIFHITKLLPGVNIRRP